MDRLPPSNKDQSLQQSDVEEELKNINNGGAGGDSGEGRDHGSDRLKRRGRRRGSKNKAKLPRNEAWAHVLEVTAGYDILESVARFARRNRVGVNVINGSGAVSTVTLQDPSGADVLLPLRGQFEIISLSGSILPSPSSPAAQWLAVCLAGEQGHVVGGRAMGPTVAARMVVIVVSLLEDTAYERPSPEVVGGSLQGSPALPPPPQQVLLGNVVNGNIPVLDVPLHPSQKMAANMINRNIPVLESPMQRWPAISAPMPPQQSLSNVVAGNIPVLACPMKESPAINQTPLQQPTGVMADGNIPQQFNGQLPVDDEHGWWGDGQVMDSLWNWDT